jgi:hypothetical protein
VENAQANKADFYVSPDGSDSWSGTLEKPTVDRTDGPFLTPFKARDAVRGLGDARRDILVLFRGGSYSLHKTFVLGLEDSAADGHTVTYAAYPEEAPVFSSGIRIQGWTELEYRPEGLPELARAKVWVADVPESLGRFRTLYDGDRRLPRARSKPFEVAYRDNERELEDAHTTLKFASGTIKAWDNVEDVEIIQRRLVFTVSILSLTSVDEERGFAKTDAPAYGRLLEITGGRPWDVKEGEQAIWVENVLEALDGPGDWVLNTQERKVYLWPLGDSPSDNIVAPSLSELFRVEGEIDLDGPTDKPVRGIVFRGLSFTQADRGVVVEGDKSIQHDWEIIDKADALVRFRGAEECLVEDCRFANSGGSAIRLDLHCQRNTVRNNEISHLGGAGVLLIGYGPGTKDVSKYNTVANNHIHHNGEIYWHSHGIVMWQSGENRIANNYIHHMPRKAICVTGVRPQFFSPDEFLERAHPPIRENTPSIRWHEIDDSDAVKACAESMPWEECDVIDWPEVLPYLHTRNNIVEDNEICRVGEILADGSAINVSGAGEGNTVRRNYIHHIFGRFHGAIRTDDYQRCARFEENIVYKTTNCGFCTRHENYWINNVIVDVRPGNSVWIGERRYDGTVFRGNIVLQPTGDLEFFELSLHHRMSSTVHEHLAKMKRGEINGNIYYQADAPSGVSTQLERIREAGHDKDSVYADPLFVDWEKGDFRLRAESPALKMGIKSIDMDKIGLTDEFPQRFIEG